MLADIVYEAMLSGLLICSVATLVLGAVLIISPERVERYLAFMNQWISTEHMLADLDKPLSLERSFYRHHLICGGLICLGGIFVIYMFTIGIEGRPVLESYDELASFWSLLGLFNTLMYMLLILNCAAVVLGLIVMIRPSLLKNLEQWSNKWVSTEQIFKSLDAQIEINQQWIPRHPRITGFVVGLGSLYILINLQSELLK